MRQAIRQVRGVALYTLILLVGSFIRAEAQVPDARITLMRDVKTYNILAFLEPESETLRTASGTLRVSAF